MNGKRHRPEQIIHKRRQYEDSAGLRKFVWDGENILLQTDSGGTTNQEYIWVREGGCER